MPVRYRLLPCLVVVLVLAALASLARAGDKLEKDQRKWLDSVRAIMLPEEEKVYRDLKKEDRAEFQKIFWARRDPDLETAENEFQAQHVTQAAEADKRYRVAGRSGSATDCGRVFLLLGEPNEVKQEPADESAGSRLAETWTYRDRPGMTFKGGQIQISFDEECQLPQGGRFGEQLAQLAARKISDPNIDYQVSGGRLTKKLADLVKRDPAQALLKEPRTDFSLKFEPKLAIRGAAGAGTYVAVLAQGDAAALKTEDVGGKKQALLRVAANAIDDAGKRAASSPAQEVTADVRADGSFVVSSALVLRPGKYAINVAVLQEATQKGSTASLPVEVPDLAAEGMTASEIVIALDIRDQAARAAGNPLGAFFLGSTQIVPQFGNVFTKQDSLQVLALVYGLSTRSGGRITLSKYGSAATGMSYASVVQLLGRDGEETARSLADGITSVTYQWKNDDGSSMSATFQDGVLATKTQAGLAELTAEEAAATAQFTVLKDGRPRMGSQELFYDTPDAAPGVGPISLEKFDPGVYVVRLKVVDKVAQKEITKEMAFEVKP